MGKIKNNNVQVVTICYLAPCFDCLVATFFIMFSRYPFIVDASTLPVLTEWLNVDKQGQSKFDMLLSLTCLINNAQ